MTPRPDPRIGTDLGPYRIESLIGRGGMGVVYLAEQPSLGRKVALKILPPELADDVDFRARFIRESKMAAAIDDPNILPIHEAGEIEGVLFIAMRYVEGTDLEQRLRSGPLEPHRVVHLLGQVASALDAAHARGLIHRDVKPANILIAAAPGDDRGEHAYLADFGLTKSRGVDTSLTRAGTLLGTLDYMAPEQLEGRELDGAADQYALAAIAFRALTGRMPFVRDSEVSLITAHLKEPVPSAVALRPELLIGVDAVIARGMAKAPHDRYGSCAAFVTELRGALGLSGALGMPTSRRSERRRSSSMVVIGGLGLALLLAGVGWVAGGSGSTKTPTTSPQGDAGASLPLSTGPVTTEDVFPDETEAALLAGLPPDLAETCVRGSYKAVASDFGNGHPIASLSCSPLAASGVTQVEVRQFPFLGTIAGNSGFTTESAISGLAAEEGTKGGDCAIGTRVNGRWELGSDDAGAIVCYRDRVTGDAVLWWSYKDASVLVKAVNQRGEPPAAYSFFEKTARFVKPPPATDARPPASSTDSLQTFPTAAEQAALALVPEAIRGSCVRGAGLQDSTGAGFVGKVPLTLGGTTPDMVDIAPKAPTVSLTCNPGSGASRIHFLWYEIAPGISGRDNTVDYLSLLAPRYGAGEGDCSTDDKALDSWSNERLGSGLVVCFRTAPFDGSPWVDWTFADGHMLALATRDDRDYDALYAWFQDLRTFLP
jgi:serine/threonine-protein kinase